MVLIFELIGNSKLKSKEDQTHETVVVFELLLELLLDDDIQLRWHSL